MGQSPTTDAADDWPPVAQPGGGLPPINVYSRDGQWTYRMCNSNWVAGVTHRPTGTPIDFQGSLATARAQARSGKWLDLIPKESTEGRDPW